MAYTNHTFCWHGIIAADTEPLKPFYTSVLRWTAKTVPMGDDEATMFAPADGVSRVHLSSPAEDGIPAHWDSFLRVDDVDASTEAAVANGGALIVAPMDITPGRMSVVASPSGAVVHLFHEAGDDWSDAPDGDGSIHWTELHSHELEKDLAWLGASFGFTTEKMPMPNGDYFIVKSGDAMVGGAMAAMEGAPSMWLPWVRVPDVDAAGERVQSAGGRLVVEAMEAPGVGRMLIAADPAGGVFGIITPASA